MFNLEIKKPIIKNLKSIFENNLFKNLLLVGAITFGAKIVSFYKETLVASTFGLSQVLDTYYVAVLLPSFVQNVFIGSLKNLFIPNYIAETKSTNQKGSFQSLIVLTILLLSTLLLLVLLLFSEFFLETVFPSHSTDYYLQVRNQLYIVLPCLYLWGLSSFLSGLLEIEEYFFESNISQFFLPLVIIVSIVFFHENLGYLTLSFGLLFGSFISLIYLLLVSYFKKLLVFKPIKINSNMSTMIDQYFPKVTSGILTGINPFIDQFFAAQLAIGAIAAINYGIKIPTFVVGILLMALGNVLLPYFSRTINENLKQGFTNLRKVLVVCFTLSAIASILLIVFSNPIVKLFFERNAFTNEDTILVAKLQQITLVYVPFYLCTLILVYFLTALNKNKFMAWVSLFNLLVNLILNYILVKHYDVFGLAFSTTIVFILSSLIYAYYTVELYKKMVTKK